MQILQFINSVNFSSLSIFHPTADDNRVCPDLYDQACKCTVRRDNKGTLIMLRCLATLVPRTTNIQLGAILIRTMASQGRSKPHPLIKTTPTNYSKFSAPNT
jgi:hypothetical protein